MKRRTAREMAIQSLYQLEMTDVTPQQAIAIIVQESAQDNEIGVKQEHAEAMHTQVLEWVHEIWEHRDEIDELFARYLKGWQMGRLSRVDKQILRLATYEMNYRDDDPPKVIINEAINLAKHFGTEESGKFANGVLGQMLRDRNAATSAQAKARTEAEHTDFE